VTPKYYYEDFPVGLVREVQGLSFTEAEIITFAKQYDPQSFHVDPQKAKDSIYGGIIASGWQTAAACMRLICDDYLLESANLGSPGIRELKWLHPVRPGDQLRLKMSVLEARVSQSKPDRGITLHRWEVFNQTGALVLDMSGYNIFLRRAAAATTKG
jgi:acyl dehydratase